MRNNMKLKEKKKLDWQDIYQSFELSPKISKMKDDLIAQYKKEFKEYLEMLELGMTYEEFGLEYNENITNHIDENTSSVSMDMTFERLMFAKYI